MRIVAMAVLLSFVAPAAWSHPRDEWIAQSRVLALWAESVSHGDEEVTSDLTAAGFPPFVGSPETVVATRQAAFSPVPDGVVAAPVVLHTDLGTMTSTWRVLLVEEDGRWKVKTVSPAPELAIELPRLDLPEHEITFPVELSLADASTGAPVYARVRISDRDGVYWPPDGHQKNIRTGWRQDVGGDVQIAGKTYAYVTPSFVARLPEGEFTIEVRRGTEYRPTTQGFSVTEEAPTNPVQVSVNRWIDMKEEGWYAGDTHTHFLDDHSGLLELRGEDLSVVYILATKWGELITDVSRFTGVPSALSSDREIVVFNEETRHGWLGHTILHGIERLVHPLTWGGPSEGVPGGFDYPPMAHQADAAHEQGALVTWAHFPYPTGELPVDVALDKIDTVDLFTWGDAFAPGPTLPGGNQLPSAVDTWYLFLNTGSRLPATAGTDKMLNVQVMGSVRTYAKVEGLFSYEAWMEALGGGRTMVSTGPVVTLTANGEPIGSELELRPGAEVALEARVRAPHDLYPVDALEIVMGGKVVASIRNDEQASELRIRATIAPTGSTWVAARARGSELMPYQQWRLLNALGVPPMAHTSPIYLSVENQGVWDAAAAAQLAARVDFAIDWVKTQGNYRTEAQREEVLALFERARRFYAEGSGQAR